MQCRDAVQTLKKDSLLTAVKGLLWIHPVNERIIFCVDATWSESLQEEQLLLLLYHDVAKKSFRMELPEESLRYVEQDITEFLRIVGAADDDVEVVVTTQLRSTESTMGLRITYVQAPGWFINRRSNLAKKWRCHRVRAGSQGRSKSTLYSIQRRTNHP